MRVGFLELRFQDKTSKLLSSSCHVFLDGSKLPRQALNMSFGPPEWLGLQAGKVWLSQSSREVCGTFRVVVGVWDRTQEGLGLAPGNCLTSEHTSHFYETFISFETSRNMPENLKTGMKRKKRH